MKTRNRWFAFSAAVLFGLLLSACGNVTPAPQATPTLEKLSIEASPAPGPQVLRQDPLPGERLGLSPKIAIVFDRPMQADKTAGAWQFLDADGKALAGNITWSDAETFQFKPDQPLKPGQTYAGVFSTAASAADGSNPAEEIRLNYQSTDELVVGQVFPADGSTDVDNKTAITVIFNKPVHALMTREEATSLPSPITIQPIVEGSGSWVNSSVYVFQPEKGLKSGTDYQVSVDESIQDTTGTRLAKGFGWNFTTRAPFVTDFGQKDVGQGYADNIENVLLDQVFQVTFNQPMDKPSVAKALSVRNVESGLATPVKLNWNSDSTILTVTPAIRFAVASFYSLNIDTTAQATDGGTLKEAYRIKLGTVPLPAITKVTPEGSKQDTYSPVVSVMFNTPMKAEGMKAYVKVLPEPSTPVKLYYLAGQNQLNISGLEPSTEYVIRILPGMPDIYGNTIKSEYSFSFETAGLTSQARLVTPNYPLIYRPKGEQAIFFEYTNINSASIALYSLSFDEFSRLSSNPSELDNLGEHSGKLVHEWTPDLQAGKDRFARILIHLDDQKPLSPGYYYLGLSAKPVAYEHRFLQGTIFIISGDSLTLKATQGEALAWLIDSESGQPVANAPLVFYNDKWSIVAQATTDKDGLAHIAEVNNVQYVQSSDYQHLALASLGWGSGVSEGQNGIWTDYWTPIKNTFVYTYTERPLYRPNQPVYIKGIVRENDDLHYSLPALKQVYLSIENEQGKVFSGDVTLSSNGTFASEYPLSADAPVGNYTITVLPSAGSDTPLSWASFRVAEYVKPEFQVSAATDRPIALNGEQVKFSLDAAYYSGGALSNANVAWFMEMRPFFYQAPVPYDGYSFNDFDYYDYYYKGGGSTNGPPVVKEGQGQTDANGHFELVETLELPKDSPSQEVAFSANVSDVGGNLVGSNTSLTLLSSSLHAGIRPEEYVSKAGDPAKFNLVVLDVNGKPVAKQAVIVSFAEQRWFSVIRKDENGVQRWETSVKSIPAGSARAVTDEKGLASVSFTPPNGGEFKAIVSAKDAKGRLSKGAAYLWVSSETYIAWRQTNDRSFQLVADKNSYNPGDTAKILIAQPFEGQNYALVTTERGHIYSTRVVQLQGNSTLYEIPITSDMAPVMYVSVMVVKGADGKTPPDFKMGLVRLNINPSRQNIFVSLESDKVTAKPGDTVTYTVTTRDLDGKPVQADVSLALVDKAVLALAPSNSAPLIEAFYPLRGLSVMSASSIVLNAEDFNANYQETSPTGQRAGGGGKGEGETGIVTVRGNFKDTAFWKAQVLTDKDGSAQVQVTLPDNLTTWQMKARAVTDDTRVGEAQSEIMSTLPLQVQLQTPRFFVVDDQARLGAVVHNNTGQDQNVKVTLKAEGLTLDSPAEQSISVSAGQQGYVTWDATVSHTATRVDLVASAEAGAYKDSTRPTLGTLPGQGLPVLSYHVTETVGSSGFLREAGSATETVVLPKTLDYQGATLSLEVSPSLAASMTDGLTYLKDYPYLCMEQTVSRFLPNLISLEALKLAGKDTGELQKALDEQVKPALQRIISNQNADGGWSLWPGGGESQPTTTAYVVLGLVEARKAGYTFPDNTLDQALTYLENQLPYNFAGNEVWKNNQAVIMVYALSLGGRPSEGRISSYYNSRDRLDIYARALLMQSMQLADPKDERLTTLLNEINNAAAQSAAGAWWGEKEVDYWNWNTDVRTTAIVTNALIQVDPGSTLIPEGVRWLMKHRQGSHWYSTQETAWSLMALTNWLKLSGEFKTDYQYAIGLNGNLLENKQAMAAHLTETTALQLDVEKLVADQANYVVITRGSGPGVLYYTAYMDFSLAVKDIPALDQGITVSQQYYRPEDPKTPINEVKRGELVQVRLTLMAPESLHYVVVDNPLPAGLEAVDASLNTSQQVPSVYQNQDFDRFGWGWWYFYYKQIYDEKVVMSADYLPAGTYTITYLARASSAGEFHVLPVIAKEFYFPDVSGRSAGTEFTVTP